MVRKIDKVPKKGFKEPETGTCAECEHAYSPRCINSEGYYFMVRCMLLKGTDNDWSKFTDQSCKNFKRTDNPINLKAR